MPDQAQVERVCKALEILSIEKRFCRKPFAENVYCGEIDPADPGNECAEDASGLCEERHWLEIKQVYPAGLALLEALDERLIEKGCGFADEYLMKHVKRKWRSCIKTKHGLLVIIGHGTSKLDARLVACEKCFCRKAAVDGH